MPLNFDNLTVFKPVCILYLKVMCFGAFSLVSMVVAVVSIQLLRLGLVNHMSDGDTLKKADHDPMVIMALGKITLTLAMKIFLLLPSMS